MTIDKDAIRAAAREKIERRLAIIDDAVDALNDVNSAKAALEDAKSRWQQAQSHYDSAYSKALTIGWSSKELKESGLPAPRRDRKNAAARSRRRAANPRNEKASPAETSEE